MKFLATPAFDRQLKRLRKKHPSLTADLAQLFDSLETDPFLGVPLGNNCFKIRLAIASKGRGKSGGGRVVTYVRVDKNTIFMVSIYDKSEQETISSAELLDIMIEAGLWPE